MTDQIQIPETVSEIAKIIRKDWTNVHFAAIPYLDAMDSVQSIDDNYYEDSAASVVAYFLANAQAWRGETAKAVKAKLNDLVKSTR